MSSSYRVYSGAELGDYTALGCIGYELHSGTTGHSGISISSTRRRTANVNSNWAYKLANGGYASYGAKVLPSAGAATYEELAFWFNLDSFPSTSTPSGKAEPVFGFSDGAWMPCSLGFRSDTAKAYVVDAVGNILATSAEDISADTEYCARLRFYSAASPMVYLKIWDASGNTVVVAEVSGAWSGYGGACTGFAIGCGHFAGGGSATIYIDDILAEFDASAWPGLPIRPFVSGGRPSTDTGECFREFDYPAAPATHYDLIDDAPDSINISDYIYTTAGMRSDREGKVCTSLGLPTSPTIYGVSTEYYFSPNGTGSTSYQKLGVYVDATHYAYESSYWLPNISYYFQGHWAHWPTRPVWGDAWTAASAESAQTLALDYINMTQQPRISVMGKNCVYDGGLGAVATGNRRRGCFV